LQLGMLPRRRERHHPPFAGSAKDGAPTSSFETGRTRRFFSKLRSPVLGLQEFSQLTMMGKMKRIAEILFDLPVV